MSKRALLLCDLLVIVLCTIGMAQLPTFTPIEPPPDPWGVWSPPRKATPTPSPSPTPITANVAWNRNVEPDIDHYNILHGSESGIYTVSDSTPDAEPFLSVSLEAPGVYYFVATAVNTGGAESGPSDEVGYNTFTMDALNAWLPHPGVWFVKQGPKLEAKAVSKKKKKARQRRRPAQSGGNESQFLAPPTGRFPAKPLPRSTPRRPRRSQGDREQSRELQSGPVPAGGE